MSKTVSHSAFRVSAALLAALALLSVGIDTAEALWRKPDSTLVDEIWRRLRYFTILTNLMVGIGLGAAAVRGRIHPGFAAALTLWIAIVGIVYHALLFENLTGVRWWTNHGLHTVVPIGVAVWWLAFAPKSGLRPAQAIMWLIYPTIYVGYVIVRGARDGVYPYFFLDPVTLGWPMLAVWVLGLAAGFWLGGVAIIALGRLLSR